MRTGRSLTVCCYSSRRGGGGSAWCRGGGFSLVPRGGLPGAGGSPWSRGGGGGLPGPGGGSPWSQGGGGLPGLGGVLLGPGGGGGVLLGPGGGFSGDPPSPPVNRITDTCKNITLATTSLRPVTISVLHIFHWHNSQCVLT